MLIAVPAIRPAWTIGRSIWLARRAGFLALLSAPLICGWLFHLSSRDFLEGDGPDLLGYLPMGLSLFLTFVFCNFTESDRRGRFDGFLAGQPGLWDCRVARRTRSQPHSARRCRRHRSAPGSRFDSGPVPERARTRARDGSCRFRGPFFTSQRGWSATRPLSGPWRGSASRG